MSLKMLNGKPKTITNIHSLSEMIHLARKSKSWYAVQMSCWVHDLPFQITKFLGFLFFTLVSLLCKERQRKRCSATPSQLDSHKCILDWRFVQTAVTWYEVMQSLSQRHLLIYCLWPLAWSFEGSLVYSSIHFIQSININRLDSRACAKKKEKANLSKTK